MKRPGTGSKVTFAEVRDLAANERWEQSLLDGLDRFLGAAILLTPAVLGPVGVFALELLQPKDELIKLGRAAIQRFAVPDTGDFIVRHRRLTAAYCLLTYTVFFDALETLMPAVVRDVKLSDEERVGVVTRTRMGAETAASEEAHTETAAPHPTSDPAAERAARVELYQRMAQAYRKFLQGLRVWERASVDRRNEIEEALKAVPERAAELFDAQYLMLVVEYPAFHRWAEMYELTKARQLTADVSGDLSNRITLLSGALEGIDIGLRHLGRLVDASGPAAAANEAVRRVADGLRAAYQDRIEERVIVERRPPRGAGPTLVFPKRCDCYLPQAFKALRYADRQVRLELDDVWEKLSSHDDLGAFLLRCLDSPYSTETPLLVLGHPGSGKSLLTEMLAARLAPPAYHPIRLELRHVDADGELDQIIEGHIKKATGRTVDWGEYADALRETPPVVILDGYDELLQASGKVFSNFLTKVQAFQSREAVQGRPVRVVVTSRITLIDKAVVPIGSTIIRLLDFDQARRDGWTAIWNGANRAYFEATGVRPFALAPDTKVLHLAAQPLLLLMLAVYDSEANELGDADLDRTSLYHHLLVRFIERERTKGESADKYDALSPADQAAQIEDDLERLGVAAIGMFNRRALVIRRDDLDRDIAHFNVGRAAEVPHGQAMTEADLLLGSFFFVYESKSGSRGDADAPADSGPTAFEFLHNTFGEFFAADFVLRGVLHETSMIHKLGSDPQMLDRLANVPDGWLSRVIFTSLHTRPEALAMLREWLPHRLADERRDPDEFEADLALFVRRQLADVLTGNAPPSIMQRVNDSPFESLPVLGHLAVYSLNLVLLWTSLTRSAVTLDETDLDVPLAGCRPWDRLVNLWRSWYSIEALAGLPAVLHARRDGETVVLSAPEKEIVRGTRFDQVRDVADALADDIVYGLAAMHDFDLGNLEVERLRDADARLRAQRVELDPLFAVRVARLGATWFIDLAERLESADFPQAALRAAERASEIHLDTANRAGAAEASRRRGSILFRMGDLDGGTTEYGRAIALFEELGDQRSLADTLRDMANSLARIGPFDRVIEHANAAISVSREVGDELGVADGLLVLGDAQGFAGNSGGAEQSLRQAMELYERLGAPTLFARLLDVFAEFLHRLDRWDDARSHQLRALDIYQQYGDPDGIAGAQAILGRVALAAGDLDEAEDRLQSALAHYQRVGERWRLGMTLDDLGETAARAGRDHVAAQRFAAAYRCYPILWHTMSAEVRSRIGEEAFAAAARQELGGEQLAEFLERTRSDIDDID